MIYDLQNFKSAILPLADTIKPTCNCCASAIFMFLSNSTAKFLVYFQSGAATVKGSRFYQ